MNRRSNIAVIAFMGLITGVITYSSADAEQPNHINLFDYNLTFDGITDNTENINAIINDLPENRNGIQTWIIIPPNTEYNFTQILPNIKDGMCIDDQSGGHKGKGVRFMYCNGWSVDGQGSYQDNNYAFASSYNPGVVVRNYGQVNAGDVYGSFATQTSPIQNIMQESDEKDVNGLVRRALYTYVDENGNSIGQTSLTAKYASGKRIERLSNNNPVSFTNWDGKETSKITDNGTYRIKALAPYSQSQVQGNNLVGQCEFISGNKCNVVFNTPEPDRHYYVYLTIENTGSTEWIPVLSISNKTLDGFVVTSSSPVPDNRGHYVEYLIVRNT